MQVLDGAGEAFVADVHREQRSGSEDPELDSPEARFDCGPAPTKQRLKRHLSTWRS